MAPINARSADIEPKKVLAAGASTKRPGKISRKSSGKSSREGLVEVAVLRYPVSESNSTQATLEILPLFTKTKNSWMPTEREASSWTALLDGKSVGTVDAKNPENAKLNPVAIEFGTFLGTLKKKAFALVANGSAADPDRWKPWKPSTNDLNSKRESYISLIKQNSSEQRAHFRCKGFSDLSETQKKITKVCPFTEKIQLRKGYINKNGLIVAQFLIETDNEGEFEGTNERFTHWLSFQSKESSPRLLFSNDLDLWDAYLVEAADFDQSGRSKLLFEASGYNLSAFYLLDENLKVVAEYKKSFH